MSEITNNFSFEGRLVTPPKKDQLGRTYIKVEGADDRGTVSAQLIYLSALAEEELGCAEQFDHILVSGVLSTRVSKTRPKDTYKWLKAEPKLNGKISRVDITEDEFYELKARGEKVEIISHEAKLESKNLLLATEVSFLGR